MVSPIPFIVAGSPRTGSSLLLQSIAAHPQVRTFGELFHPWADPRPGAGPAEQDRFDEKTEDAIAFLDRAVWPLATETKPAVGFKLFVSHTESPGTRDLFHRLGAAHPELRVVHSRRTNYLDVWVSLKKAELTGIWVQYPGAEHPSTPSPITPSPSELFEFFEQMARCDALLQTFHDTERTLVVDYHDLSASYARTLGSVWSFLGIPAVSVAPPLVKQNRSPHSEFLTNYDLLRDSFGSTGFERFFR